MRPDNLGVTKVKEIIVKASKINSFFKSKEGKIDQKTASSIVVAIFGDPNNKEDKGIMKDMIEQLKRLLCLIKDSNEIVEGEIIESEEQAFEFFLDCIGEAMEEEPLPRSEQEQIIALAIRINKAWPVLNTIVSHCQMLIDMNTVNDIKDEKDACLARHKRNHIRYGLTLERWQVVLLRKFRDFFFPDIVKCPSCSKSMNGPSGFTRLIDKARGV